MKMPMSVVGRKVEIRHLISANAGGSDDYETCAAASTTTLPRLHPERGSEVPPPMSVCAPPKNKAAHLLSQMGGAVARPEMARTAEVGR